MAKIKPRWAYEKLKGTREKKVVQYVTRKDETTDRVYRERVEKVVKVPLGYMVYFPQGHSLHVETDEELRRLGLDGPIGLVDMETGEMVDAPSNPLADLKRVVDRTTRDTPFLAQQ